MENANSCTNSAGAGAGVSCSVNSIEECICCIILLVSTLNTFLSLVLIVVLIFS